MPPRLSTLLLLLAFSTGCARENFFQPDARLDATSDPAATDSVLVTAGRHYQRGPVHNLLLGKHYRPVWATPVWVPVLNPATAVPGGLTPGKLGGGFQSTSMTVLGPDGREYALRSIDKDPFRTLPKIFRKTFALNLVRDATSAANPYGSFVVAPLAEAAGLLHTTPRPFYVRSDETGLGEESALFQGKLVLLEEKFEDKASLTPAFGKATDLLESDDLLRDRFADPAHRVDQVAFARARLFDLWIGDWDRHEGQWSWAAYPDANGITTYRPVPQDRDQAFFRFKDGIIPWIVSRPFLVGKFRTFRPEYESLEGMTQNSRFIDERFLNEVTAADFQRLATDLQTRLDDAVIADALKRFPPPVFAREGAYIQKSLQARRANLPTAANAFYRLLARHVTVVGTDQNERFVVRRLTDSTTAVTVYTLGGKSDRDSVFYNRVFRSDETQEITLHGLEGKDVFELSGEVRRGPRINIYGGPNSDKVTDSTQVRGLSKKTRYYDTHSDNELTKSKETRDKTEKGVKMHAYDREGT
ncbi:conserved hypothetical protein [Hymenobacter roseosalivarius DSM 11622]|uniref:Lipoprotein n=1 Tax=Hymenobacter roseosalivarius DSM 11622 TaxID=645990 RepID=A0A1W1W2U6_9BACT|nr:hypothetical protein [Hymenobacter roseosalivarius]SMB99937.1 conserved hypothetical protein [Hymenobacter roseosalivarius DSM 11622]